MSSLAYAIDIIRPSVVQISIGGSNHMRPTPIGTGFIVSSTGYVLTARHVIHDGSALIVARQIQNGRFLVGLAQPSTENMRGNFTLVEGKVIEEDPRHDLALLRMQPNPFEGNVSSGVAVNGDRVPLLLGVAARSPSRPRDGSSIAVSGYPLSETVLITTSGALASAWAFDMQQVSPPGAPAGFTMPDIKDCYLADISVNPGNSGGPVYRIPDGSVIGVCVAFRNTFVTAGQQPVVVNGEPLAYNSGLSIVVPISYGDELLARHST